MTRDDVPTLTIAVDAEAATDRDSWLALMDQIGEEAGHFQPLGARHWAFFVDESPILLVSFESLDEIRADQPGQMPLGHAIASGQGWSHLCLIADGETWYRDPAVYGYFDRLVDDAFFEDFDRVVFYGAGMGGYAACAFSVTAPGATVVAVQPVATLDPAVVGWDRRHLGQRRLNFTDRYGYAPDMTEGTGEVFVVVDPVQVPDAMHAALFRRPHVTVLRCPHLGDRLEVALSHMQILTPMIEAAGEGRLTPAAFARLWRARRQFGPYLRQMLTLSEQAGHLSRAARVCRSVTNRMSAPRFRKRLAELEALMAAPPEPPSASPPGQ
ncbi:phosphoadenosine phosphosulfate reductase [Paracoccaceae bacterium Fryx2]|nr:phosphoadenosine phosphosulfate reductase [Paracoccaceae bacterium Fryx2]